MNSAQAGLLQLLLVYWERQPSGCNSTRWPCEISCFPYILEGKRQSSDGFCRGGFDILRLQLWWPACHSPWHNLTHSWSSLLHSFHPDAAQVIEEFSFNSGFVPPLHRTLITGMVSGSIVAFNIDFNRWHYEHQNRYWAEEHQTNALSMLEGWKTSMVPSLGFFFSSHKHVKRVFGEPLLGCFLLPFPARPAVKRACSVQNNVAFMVLIETVNIQNEWFPVGTFVCLYGAGKTFIDTFIWKKNL